MENRTTPTRSERRLRRCSENSWKAEFTQLPIRKTLTLTSHYQIVFGAQSICSTLRLAHFVNLSENSQRSARKTFDVKMLSIGHW